MMADGHLNKCKECAKLDARTHRNDNIEAAREYDRSRASLPHRVKARQDYVRHWIAEHPDKHAAHTAVSNALRSKKLVKEPCAFCGTPEPVEAHHHDYTKPLDITWLCIPCHRRFHALERMSTYRPDEAA
jgi:hypothetical protein